MSQGTPDHRADREPRRSWRRRILITLGSAAVLGGLGWSASAATAWLSPAEEAAVPAAATPEEAAQVQDTTEAVDAWLSLAHRVGPEDAVSDDLVFGAGAFASQAYPGLTEALAFARERVATIAADPSTSP